MFDECLYILLGKNMKIVIFATFSYFLFFNVEAASPVQGSGGASAVRSRQAVKVNHYFSDEMTMRVLSFTTGDLYREGYQQNCDAIISNNYTQIKSPYVAVTDEQRLTCFLLNNYSTDIRPVLNTSELLVVNFSLSINQIFDLDDHDQILTMNVWFEQTWKDIGLQWNPSDYGNLKSLNLPSFYVFLPDIELYNTAADYTKRRAQFRTMVQNDGTIFYGVPAKVLSTCHVNPTWFPFDTQICRLKFGSWTYSGLEIDLQPSRETGVDLSRFVASGKWDLVDVLQRRNSLVYSCCPETCRWLYHCVKITGRAMYYIVSVYFFTAMLVLMTLAVYQLPICANERCSLGTSVLFSLSVFMLSITEKLPESSEYVPVINVYLFMVMGMTAGSLAITVGIHAIHYQHAKPVPHCKLAQIQRLPKIFRALLRVYRRHRGKWVVPSACEEVKEYKEKKQLVKKLRNYQVAIFIEVNKLIALSHEESLRREVSQQNKSIIAQMNEMAALEKTIKDKKPLLRGMLATVIGGIEEVYFAIERLADSYETQVQSTYNLLEWHELAELCDVILFWCFAVITVSAFSFIFGVASYAAPAGKELIEELEHKHGSE